MVGVSSGSSEAETVTAIVGQEDIRQVLIVTAGGGWQVQGAHVVDSVVAGSGASLLGVDKIWLISG